MIKIERKDTEKTKIAMEALCVAKEKGSTYNTEEVNAALTEIFHGKCYKIKRYELKEAIVWQKSISTQN